MPDQNPISSSPDPDPDIEGLARSLAAVGVLIDRVRPDQWSAPTPCADWTVRRLVDHLIGMNRVFIAMLAGQPAPQRPAAALVEPDPAGAYRDTAATLLAAFRAPNALDRVYQGPLGSATGAQRLQIRLYDLLAHGWDLARATGQQADLPAEVAAQSLAFARTHLTDQARAGRFAPAQAVDESVPALEQLVAFLGRSGTAGPPARALDDSAARLGLGTARLRRGIVLRVAEDSCEILTDGHHRTVGYARQFPAPRTERVSPGHLVAVATTPHGTAAIVWRWYDAVVLGEQGELVRLWEPAHGEVLARRRPGYLSPRPGSRAYLSAGLPGADWWVAGPASAVADDADVELDEVVRLYTEHRLGDDLA